MPAERTTLDQTLQQLAAAARNGKRAKGKLLAAMVKMTPVQLKRVPPVTFVRLGPEGLRAFAAGSRAFAGIVAAPSEPSSKSKPESRSSVFCRKWHFVHPLAKCAATIVVCGSIAFAAEFLVNASLEHYRRQHAEMIAGWPRCTRLDGIDIDCIYRTTSAGMTLNRIVDLTALSPETVVGWNVHLDFRLPLQAGALVVIPAGHVAQ